MSDITPFIQQAGKAGEHIKSAYFKEKSSLTQAVSVKDKARLCLQNRFYTLRDSAAGISTMTFYDPNLKNTAL